MKTSLLHRGFTASLALFASVALTADLTAAKLDLANATILELQDAMDAGALSSEKLLDVYLKRISAYDQSGPKLNAVIVMAKDAMAQARALDAERKAKGPRGPLHGIPILVKDVFDVAGLPTAGAFKPMADSFPARDGFVIKKLRDAGAIVFGKLNQSDWFGVAPRAGSTLAGQVHNPYDLTRIPGASSSGTAAAVAAWFCSAGLGSDTGSSVQTPSADTNLYGLVGTRGLISRTGMICSSTTQERGGPICRSMTDLAVLLTYMVGFDAEDLSTADSLGRLPDAPYTAYLDKNALKGARLGVLRNLFYDEPAHAEDNRLMTDALARIKETGALLVDVRLDLDIQSVNASASVSNFERKPSHNWYLSRLPEGAPIRSVDEMIAKAPDIVKPGIKESNAIPSLDHHPEYLARLKQQEMLRNALVGLMDQHGLDALVYPYKTMPPAKIGASENSDRSAGVSSRTGLPALCAPTGLTKDGLPMSIQFLGRPFTEHTLVALGYAYEQITPARKAPPTTPALSGEVFEYMPQPPSS